ncbi:MAG: tRNA (N6-isopentenyl adenosine(37)-C2)-methylthiotransferase MiaB, partial [Flavobacteriales bacterium]|nr:tRNA (N6-isopentenyl adenosine(37)-C2)-methylthiotransferase MiaB [Flavobacteriales bacterium]MDW8410822.1 tRNA (N6-isopentenyl adenosine(37)-C2)-methylthiotransferase MiaB [Flavobacteriales bacterium]
MLNYSPQEPFGLETPVDLSLDKGSKRFYIESYGCQMNFSDSEIVASVMEKHGYQLHDRAEGADVVFLNTCAIRENAEQRVRARLRELKKLKKQKPSLIVGMLGCMAERLKEELLEQEKLVDVVAGPDAYRDLPNLVEAAAGGQKSMNVQLSLEETYADIAPVRLSGNGVSAFITIMRGCDNMCTFCVVPFTRGRERSRDPQTILHECEELWNKGYKEVTLLGQNVDSYLWFGGGPKKEFRRLPEEEKAKALNFSGLLEKVASAFPNLRIRFTTSHPRDFTDEVLEVMARYPNICPYIHLPVQSGSTRILQLMNRGYSREWYLERVAAIKEYLPHAALSTDIITGFCTETEADHLDTLSLMQEVGFDSAYMFKYSERPGTPAAKKYKDDVPDEIKTR